MTTPTTALTLSKSDRTAFGQIIAARRHALGLSQRELADRLCAITGRPTMTRNEVSRYERGLRRPTGPALTALATCLDMTPDSLTEPVTR